MPRLPQLAALLRIGGVAEFIGTEFRGNLAELLGLQRHGLLRPVELDKQRRPLAQRQRRIGVDGLDLHFVQQFDPRNRMPIWIVMMTVSQAALRLGKAQTPPLILAGIPCSFSVTEVMMPSVPSARHKAA